MLMLHLLKMKRWMMVKRKSCKYILHIRSERR